MKKKNPKMIVIEGGLPKEADNTPSNKSVSKGKSVQLRSGDRVYIEVDADEPIAMEANVIRNWIKYGVVGELTLPYKLNVLLKAIEFCNKHAEIQSNNSDDEHENLKEFHSRFVKENQSILIDLLSVACHLQIRSLLDVTSESVAEMINDETTAEEIHKMFNLKEDFTFKEMDRVIRYDAFCYKGIM